MEKASRIGTRLLVLIPLAYGLAVAVNLFCQTFTGVERTREARGFQLQHALRFSRPLIKDGRTRELSQYLQDARRTGMLEYYEFENGDRREVGGTGPERR